MSRMRARSEAAASGILSRMTIQRHAADTIKAASNTAAAIEATADVAADLAAIDVDGITAALADYEARLSALETP